MKALAGLLTVPIICLNFLSGIVSGTWLVVLGEWWAIGYGVAGWFSSIWLGWLVLIGIVFSGPAVFFLQKGRAVTALPFVFLGQIYVFSLMTAWCVLILNVFMSRAGDGTFWPLLIWSYGVALGPWMSMAHRDALSGNDSSTLPIFFAQIAYIVTMIMLAFGINNSLVQVTVFGSIMLIAALIETAIVIAAVEVTKKFERVEPLIS